MGQAGVGAVDISSEILAIDSAVNAAAEIGAGRADAVGAIDTASEVLAADSAVNAAAEVSAGCPGGIGAVDAPSEVLAAVAAVDASPEVLTIARLHLAASNDVISHRDGLPGVEADRVGENRPAEQNDDDR